MQIYSVRSVFDLSAQTSDMIRALVSEARGPIVLPLNLETIRYCRKEAQKPAVVKAIQEHRFPLDFWMIAVLALAERKVVFPFYTSDFKKMGKKFGAVERMAEVVFDKTQDHAQAASFRKRGVARVSAEQLVALADRWRKNAPALVITEDNFAHVLGRLFRIKVHRLTRDDPVTKRLVRQTLREVPRALGFEPRPRRKRK